MTSKTKKTDPHSLQELIRSERSKEYVQYLADEVIGDNTRTFAELWRLVREGEPPIPQRAVWILELCEVNYPKLVKPYLGEFIAQLEHADHNAIQRHLTKILARHEIPEKYRGHLYDLSMKWIASPRIHVAIKAHSMDIACNIAMGTPDLEEELAFVIKDQLEFNTAGFKARAKKVFKKMKRPFV